MGKITNEDLINGHTLEELFDIMGEKFTDKDKGKGAVIIGVCSSDEETAFHAAHGDAITISTLVTSIIRHTAKDIGMPPTILCGIIFKALEATEEEIDEKA